MKYTTVLLLTSLAVFGCNRKVPAATTGTNPAPVDKNGIPACIQQKIDSIKNLPVWNPPASVEEYQYNGKRLFLFSADCCDFFSTAFDENCNYVCAPSGGFTGKGDGKCTDFNDNAKLVKTVWKDERKKK